MQYLAYKAVKEETSSKIPFVVVSKERLGFLLEYVKISNQNQITSM